MSSFRKAAQAVMVGSSLLMLAACGSTASKKTHRSNAGQQQSGETKPGDCPKLTDASLLGKTGGDDIVIVPTDGKSPCTPDSYAPGQDTPSYDQPGKGSADYDLPGKGDEPGSYVPGQVPTQAPGQYPTQAPSQSYLPGKDEGCKGCEVSTYEPKPYPQPAQMQPETCGKNGKYCDDGGPGQYPGADCDGGSYDRGQLDACLMAYRGAGYDTHGMWNVRTKVVNAMSMLASTVIEDRGSEPSIVMINAFNMLGNVEFRLLNPNALYCVNNVAIFQGVQVTSCHESNVVFGSDISFLSGGDGRVVQCRY